MSSVLSMKNIYKIYPNGIIANNYINLEVKKGEIHALVGENGAGKTTLMKILFGIENSTDGEIQLNGEVVNFKNPQEAIKAGIGMVHQHFMQVPSLTVAENIILGNEPKKNGFMVDHLKAIKNTSQIAEKYSFKINPKMKLEDCSVGTRQKIEILKALYQGIEILILDEPTAVLTPQETVELFEELRILKKKGHTIIFISHKLNEIKAISDRVTILRNAKSLGTFLTSKLTKDEISNLMVGREADWSIKKKTAKPGETLVHVSEVSKLDNSKKFKLNRVSFSLRSGEIIGVVGVEGNGQRELVDVLTGLDSLSDGKILIQNNEINNLSVQQIRQLNLSHIPEDRMLYGIAAEASIKDNLLSTHSNKKEFNQGVLLNKNKVNQWAENLVNEYKVVTSSANSPISSLSGGNIQKVVVAREFSSQPLVVIADQPTRGIDVGAAQFIHKKLIELRDEGAGILLVSADLNEVMELSDSVIVLFDGEIVAFFEDVKNVSEHEIGRYMLGVERQDDTSIRRCVRA